MRNSGGEGGAKEHHSCLVAEKRNCPGKTLRKPSGKALASRLSVNRAGRVNRSEGSGSGRILGVSLGDHRWNGVFLTEIPAAVIYRDRRDLLWRKRHFSVTSNLDHAAFAGHHLVKNPAVLQGDGNDLISGPGMAVPPEIICPFDWYWS
jgi:hypothetical protein